MAKHPVVDVESFSVVQQGTQTSDSHYISGCGPLDNGSMSMIL